ncbi:hypothetical protein [Gordonia liuliyuniae]|uniref:PPE family protein n=1 Tax=Gordonia liuliyuniae TaxID=2911517 RepID=A0ABS9IRT7_9ACTN|nr:hypothetical protein [Gordonia liuliyuniae]MCF8588237.1 hypothetical protein [Gordonia liuliyuniae]
MGTVWSDIETALARIDSMDAGAASADAAEIRRIVAAAQTVAARLTSVFAASDVLAGASADASTVRGTALASLVDTSVAGLQTGANALDNASTALAASISHRERIAGLTSVEMMPETRIALESALQGLMTGAYNVPMSSSTSGVVVPESEVSNWTAAGTSGVSAESGAIGSAWSPGVADTADTASRADLAAGGPGSMPSGVTDGTMTGEQAGSPRESVNSVGAARAAGAPAMSTTTGSGRPDFDPAGSGPSPSGPVVVTPTVTSTAGDLTSTSPLGPWLLAPGVSGVPVTGGSPTSSMRSPGVPGTSLSGQTSTGQALSGRSLSGQSASAGAAAAARTSSASPAMGPGAVRRKDDDDHTTADYLRSTREGELLLGTAPLVTPALLPPPVASIADSDDESGGDRGVVADVDVDQRLDPTL